LLLKKEKGGGEEERQHYCKLKLLLWFLLHPKAAESICDHALSLCDQTVEFLGNCATSFVLHHLWIDLICVSLVSIELQRYPEHLIIANRKDLCYAF
jgi:hypothetical protein